MIATNEHITKGNLVTRLLFLGLTLFMWVGNLTAADLLPPGTGTGLRAVYWDGLGFNGNSAVVLEPRLNHAWGLTSPAAKINPENFTASWMADLEARTTEQYTFTAIMDGGMQVEIDGQKIIDSWPVAMGKKVSAIKGLVAGTRYRVRVIYQHSLGGQASAQLRWASPSIPEQIIPSTQLYPYKPDILVGTGTGMQGIYFPTKLFLGQRTTRIDPNVYFTWSGVSPAHGIAGHDFSVQWRGSFTAPYASSYRFYLEYDNGAALFVNGKFLCGRLQGKGLSSAEGVIYLKSGESCELNILYFQENSAAICRLSMSTPEIPRMPIPTVLLTPMSAVATGVVGTGTGLQGNYFDQEFWNGEVKSRLDSKIAFQFSPTVEPIKGLGLDAFSAKWSGWVEPQFNEPYTFYLVASDTCAVWFDDQLIADIGARDASDVRSFTTPPLVVGKRYSLKIANSNSNNGGQLQLTWQSPSTSFAVVPTSQLYPNRVVASSPFAVDHAPLSGEIAGLDAVYPGLPLTVPIESYVSPAWVEGTRISRGNPVSARVDSKLVSVNQADMFRWYIDGSAVGRPSGVELTPGLDSTVLVSQGRGLQSSDKVLVPVRWIPINLFSLPYGVSNLDIRAGDSLLLTGTDVAGSLVDLDVDYKDGTFAADMTGIGVGGAPVKFSVPGIYNLVARQSGMLSAPFRVRVIGLNTQGPTACEVGYVRSKSIRIIPSEAASTVSITSEDISRMTVAKLEVTGGQAEISIHPLVNERVAYQVRLYAGGPIIEKQTIDVFDMTNEADKTINQLEVYPDGTILMESRLNMTPPVDGLTVKISVFKAGATFDDSTTSRTLSTTSDFTHFLGLSQYPYRLVQPSFVKGGPCHSFTVYQNSVQVSY